METNMDMMDSSKLHWAENKIREANRRLDLLGMLPTTDRSEEIKKASLSLSWAMKYLKEYQEEMERENG